MRADEPHPNSVQNASPDDATLGGYFRVHDRPPAYEGRDGHPYTVSIEIERTGDLKAPYSGYLVFPRWARTGVGIVGHVESEVLTRGDSGDVVTDVLERMSLLDVQEVLNRAIHRREEADGD